LEPIATTQEEPMELLTSEASELALLTDEPA